MRERHWKEVFEVTGQELSMDPETFKVGDLLQADLLTHAEILEEISQGSTKEPNRD